MRAMLLPAAALAAASLLAGCSTAQQAQTVASAALPAPAAARFGAFSASDDGRFACVGVTPASGSDREVMLRKVGGRWTYLTATLPGHEDCVERINQASFWGRG